MDKTYQITLEKAPGSHDLIRSTYQQVMKPKAPLSPPVAIIMRQHLSAKEVGQLVRELTELYMDLSKEEAGKGRFKSVRRIQ